MPDERFKGDPYTELGWPRFDERPDQRRWRELAREHHPDRAAGDREEAARLTTRMAHINEAYDLLRDPVRRAAYDATPAGEGHVPNPGLQTLIGSSSTRRRMPTGGRSVRRHHRAPSRSRRV